MRIFIAGLASLVLLAGCGGGGGATPSGSTSAGTITVLAGQVGAAGSADGSGSAARFSAVSGMAIDRAGNLYLADKQMIRKVTPAGAVTTLAGSAGAIGSDNGIAAAARFADPRGVAVDNAGNVYVADFSLRKITPAGVVTTIPNSGPPKAWNGSGPTFGTPYRALGVAVDTAGNLYATYSGYPNTVVQKITPAGVVSTLAGALDVGGSTTDGVGAAARFTAPGALTADASGNVYVLDGDTVRKISSAGVVSTPAAPGLSGPSGLAVDEAGNLFISDAGNHLIRKLSASGVLSTLAGKTGTAAVVTGSLPGGLFSPSNVAVDAAGAVYTVSDQALLKIQP